MEVKHRATAARAVFGKAQAPAVFEGYGLVYTVRCHRRPPIRDKRQSNTAKSESPALPLKGR